MDSIEYIDLPDGGLKLTSRARHPDARLGGDTSSAARWQAAARVITMAWGDRYVADLLSLTIPALLAPGNLPTLTKRFNSEFVIVTEQRLFNKISGSPVIRQLLSYCDLRLLRIDDLLSSWYGITLTYALVRGFADLGPAMVDTHLIFLNADFIVADGSYATLVEMIDRGERLIVSPSYCMVLEDTIEPLRARFNPDLCSLSIPPREMASLIIDHRHNTIRAKTANQQLFRIHRYDQLYWYVDEKTLLCRQMPIALVYMRPERVLTELPTFWDYGVISEFCPTVKPCVLSDSDDFLMAELRTESTFSELLHLGWPTINEIAEDLSSYVTKDHHDYGRYTLVLHAKDLPPTIDEENVKFAQFVDRVYAKLKPPISYINHHFWAAAFPRFLVAQQQKQDELRRAAELEASLRVRPEFNRIKTLRERRRAIDARLQTLALEESVQLSTYAARRIQLESAFRQEMEALEHARHDDLALETERRLLQRERREVEQELSPLLTDQGHSRECQLGSPSDDGTPLPDFATGAAPAPAGGGPARLLARAARFYQTLFGSLPGTTPWHPYHHMLLHVNAALRSDGDREREILVLSSGGAVGATLTRPLKGRKVYVTAKMVVKGTHPDLFEQRGRFGLCFCDLAFDDLALFRQLLDKLRPLLQPGARVVLFHHNAEHRSLDEHVFSFTTNLFPIIGRSRISFAGSRAGALAARWFDQLLHRVNLFSPRGMFIGTVVMAICALPARLASQRERTRAPHTLPARCTSMVIEITHLS
jgi:hypothetical protein